MLRASSLVWWSLGILTKKRHELLMRLYGDLDTPLEGLGEGFLRELKVREEGIREALDRLAALDLTQLERTMERESVRLCTWEDAEYPRQLREIGDPPMFLSYKGDLSLLDAPCVGLVGTRSMSAYGRRVAVRFAEGFARSGIVTVSGLAAGIDTVVAEETLKAGGRTAAVLGHGLSHVSPAGNRLLAARIVESGGVILSEFPFAFPGSTYTFPARNRIIAGLSRGTVVLEAPLKSGALITADLALDYGRDVFAVPGNIFDPNAEGCHSIIASGQAKLVASPDDVLTEWGAVAARRGEAAPYETEDETERRVYVSLSSLPKSADELVEETGLSASDVGSALTMMELAGVAGNVGGKWFRKLGNSL